MPVLTVVALYVVRWDANLVVKFLTIIVATLVLTVLLYDLLVKRVAPLRFVFAMSVRDHAETHTREHEPYRRCTRSSWLSRLWLARDTVTQS